MAIETLYAGPGKLYRNATAFFPEGESGDIGFDIDQEKLPVASGMHGRVRSQQGNVTGKIATTPFDNWGILGAVYPAFLGATVGATVGALSIGTLAFGAANAPTATKIWTPDGRLYTAVRTAITKHPDLHLGVGKPLYGPMEISCIGDAAKQVGDAAFLYTITESGAADPGGNMTMADFIRESWTGAWTGASFGTLEAEEEWIISCTVKYNFYKVQRLTRMARLASVEWMARARLVGPTHTQIDAAIGFNNGRLLGSSFATANGGDLVLTSQSGKTVTLKNCDAVGVGYEFGNSEKLGTGEVGFVTATQFTAGAPQPLIVFSA